MRFQGVCYRAHDPRWSFSPLSGEGAAVHGGRFNPRGMPALYLSQSIETAVMEANQGFANKIEPCVLVSYDVDCEPIADLTTEAGREAVSADLTAMSCPWLLDVSMAKVPASWTLARRLVSEGWAGALVPSFAARAAPHDVNLVLWNWGPDLPRRVQVFDPHERLPKDQRSWG